ncbi:cache domain-containing sensor histidine kinase [Paenibacillus methanolicus]|uniref:Two-component system sensor histidine kinase YesM n=1 Tax=Paenibacillus methanolicus TaxID=582686 RepID=A0A5S5CGW1_9BACL|nr:sensor histidine kinase [Paenibacillus methanolicus]TYP79016.1 two-component system sensor histidine kinase YesM [Paenibacillus methanolicus]
MKLRRKILLAIILLIFIPVLAMGVISYTQFSKAIETKSSSFYGISLLESDRKLKFALNEISAVSGAAITQPVIQQALKRGGQNPGYERRQEMINLLINHPMIDSFSLITTEGQVIGYNVSEFGELRDQPWFNRMKAAEGKPIWSGPGENGSSYGGKPILIHARVVKDYYSLEDIGYLVMGVKPDILEQVFWEAATLRQGDMLLVNKEGAIVYDRSGEATGVRADFPFLSEEAYEPADNHYIDRYGEVRSLITYMPSHNTQWMWVAITPLALLRSESEPIRNTAIILVAFSLLSALMFDRFFVLPLVSMINSAVNGMKRVEQRIFKPIRPPLRTTDESGRLIEGFNRMSGQIQELLVQVETEQARKKEAEMQALMSQINPHFIYNSLESINSMAVLQGNKDISRMVVSLGKLLRISISESQELIPLAMEFEHVRHYLYIQKLRFEDQFEFEIALPESLKPQLTQKLIVQPIVENALYHAIEPMREKGWIRIHAEEGRDCLYIYISDNGPGFDPNVLKQPDDETAGVRAKYKDKGVGLRNVQERLRIRFGRAYGILICTSPDCGTTIRIRIPKGEFAKEGDA